MIDLPLPSPHFTPSLQSLPIFAFSVPGVLVPDPAGEVTEFGCELITLVYDLVKDQTQIDNESHSEGISMFLIAHKKYPDMVAGGGVIFMLTISAKEWLLWIGSRSKIIIKTSSGSPVVIEPGQSRASSMANIIWK